MVNGIRTGDPHGFNKGCSSKFHVGCWVQRISEEGQRIYQLKHSGNNNKDDNSPKTLIFLYFWREKISKIILGCDPSNFNGKSNIVAFKVAIY